MTDVSLPAGRFAQSDFRVGHVLNRAWSVFSGNFLKLGLVTGVAALPAALLPESLFNDVGNRYLDIGLAFLPPLLWVVLTMLSQAIVFYGAFQDMSGRPVNLVDGLTIGLGRVFPLIGLAVVALAVVAAMIGASFLLASPVLTFVCVLVTIPAVLMMWSMAMPACVVERLGPFRSLSRSRALTKGFRGRILGLLLVTLIFGAIVSGVLDAILGLAPAGGFGAAARQTIDLIWNALWAAFFAVVNVVAYHDLRVAKEGVDTAQVAAVFE
jgi:hypothetical protein